MHIVYIMRTRICTEERDKEISRLRTGKSYILLLSSFGGQCPTTKNFVHSSRLIWSCQITCCEQTSCNVDAFKISLYMFMSGNQRDILI